MKAIILHGTGNNSGGNWFPWLSGELKKLGWEVWVPDLPEPGHPSGEEWRDYVLKNAPFEIDDQVVLIGHSSGGVCAMLVAQNLTAPVKATFVVSAPRNNDFLKWEGNNRLFNVPFDPEGIRKGAGKLVFVHSDDDPYCPPAETKELCDHAGGEWVLVLGQGHFNLEKGEQYRQFPRLLQIIQEGLKG